MTQVTIDLPDILARLPQSERDSLLRAGLHEAIRARKQEMEKQMGEALDHIAEFEQSYGMSFAQFETELLPTLDTPQGHNDYNDLFDWQSVLEENKRLLASLT